MMPKFGLKCFLGSFVLSLAAVFAVTEAYLYYTKPVAQTATDENLTAYNIDLFAVKEEKDPILEKYEQIMASTSADDFQSQSEDEATIIAADTASVPTDTDDILFAPSEDTDFGSEDTTAFEQTTENIVAIPEPAIDEKTAMSAPTTTTEEFKIVDASEATLFEIPLTHGFSLADDKVKVSNEAAANQVASANADVNHLGVDGKAPPKNDNVPSLDDDEEDSPWVVAEVANKNITRNQNVETAEKPATGNSVPYKMQKNILIPIPDEIANDKNLTPQFSSSAENIKLEQELRRKHSLPPLNEPSQNAPEKISRDNSQVIETENRLPEDVIVQSIDNETAKDEDNSSLTDSIAAWFSGGRKKSGDKAGENKSQSEQDKSAPGKESSLFRKLLGLGASSKDNIAPTELKLSFQANRAEISGQTLEWIKAFSENVVNYDDVAIEIRIDRSASYELQQKRLKLLYKILANNGVEYRKVNIIFTDREPNSFIIRNVRYVTKEEKAEVAAKAKSPWY